MKKLSALLFVSLINLCTYAQSNVEKAIKSALTELDSAKTLDDMKAVGAKFDRISAAEVNEWLPRYYSSYIYCILAFKNQDPADKKSYLDYAQKQLDEAMKIDPKESEIFTLQGMIYQAIIGIDPMNNGQVYSGKAAGAFNTAMRLDPNNPRPYYLQGLSVMYTPEQYGGGKKAAVGLFTKANELYASFVPASDIAPNWGKEDCARNLAACQEK